MRFQLLYDISVQYYRSIIIQFNIIVAIATLLISFRNDHFSTSQSISNNNIDLNCATYV